ncbi:MAG: response regulator transcription factor, partial [Eubacteriales bacterium]|nr:response regulator transcription factor [Eubacteriales bacterium]
MIEKNGYDAILLDIMMPKKDGIEVLKELRSRNVSTPVLMLTAKAEVDDRVTGLDAGADDYLTKPFAMKELVARVNALTRRNTGYSSKQLSFGNITLNADSQELKAENTVRLSVRELEMMQVLITNRDRDVDSGYLLEHVWTAPDDVPSDEDEQKDLVWLYVSYLKGKLEYINAACSIKGERGGAFRLVDLNKEN